MDFDFYTKDEINAMLNGLSFIKMSKADYEALTTVDPNTIYYVYDENGNITQYMGDAEMTSGKSTIGTVTALTEGTTISNTGTATYQQSFALTAEQEQGE